MHTITESILMEVFFFYLELLEKETIIYRTMQLTTMRNALLSKYNVNLKLGNENK